MKKKILIVDDSAFSRSIMKKAIQSMGYEIIQASNGKEAITVYQAEKPDAVTMDLLMPDMDGMDAVRKIRENDPDARIIICSTDKQKFRQEEAKSTGTVGFVPKPVDTGVLEGILAGLFNE